MEIRTVVRKDLSQLAQMAALLWESHTKEELIQELEGIFSSPDAVFFLAEENGVCAGFAQCQIRHDYVEGTSGGPVGYLEGIFVRKEFRRNGIARLLLSACEAWARQKGCREFASDCETGNSDSLHFHLSLGFHEANRIICFAKKL